MNKNHMNGPLLPTSSTKAEEMSVDNQEIYLWSESRCFSTWKFSKNIFQAWHNIEHFQDKI